MTPQREQYLAKCGKKERWLREKIEEEKWNIRYAKNVLTNEGKELFWFERASFYNVINFRTRKLGILRHELNRLKGWDRGVVPKQTIHEVLPATTNRPALMSKPYYICKCGETVGFLMGNEWHKAKHCTVCGRRILWKKVRADGI